MLVKIDGVLREMTRHYENAVEVAYAVVENGLKVSSHSFRKPFSMKSGMVFRTNGYKYEVVKGE